MAQKSHKNNKHIAELIESATVTALQLLAQVDKFAMLGGIDASLPDDQARAALETASQQVRSAMANLESSRAGVAQAQTKSTYAPTKRGGGGVLRLLFWQGPTLLNPHFASGSKDQEGSRPFLEPLIRFDADGDPQPVLAAEVPSRAVSAASPSAPVQPTTT
mgnify:CR=1 FL=1